MEASPRLTARNLGDLDDGPLRAVVAAGGEFGPVGDGASKLSGRRLVPLQNDPGHAGEELAELVFAMSDLNLSARAYDRILKVARTIADLASAVLSKHPRQIPDT